MKLVLTGVAGFIGMHTAQRLLQMGHEVTGLDNLNQYYDPQLKLDRLALLTGQPGFRFEKLDITDGVALSQLVANVQPRCLLHLAAQAGVRHSIDHPMDYVAANLVGFMNVLEACRQQNIEHLVYASSSSVYGNNAKTPFSEHDAVDHPLSIYAASKRANELMAHVYSHLHALPTTGLRFFTVYGPWGRPDMAPIMFARKMLAGETIGVFNFGHHQRDFTYIDDIVSGVIAVATGLVPAKSSTPVVGPDSNGDPAISPAVTLAPFRIYNIGNSQPVQLMDFLAELENCLGVQAKLEMLPAQPGDVQNTWADCSELATRFGYHSNTSLAVGMQQFIHWFKGYYSSDSRNK
ncbi:MAG: NAD-dependent epimerase/dehydratase family protein [Xanthomonadales bacterium]|nr:NAD-dependent epimerase/dehydratase family protein [Xanthomonadales bacterium]